MKQVFFTNDRNVKLSWIATANRIYPEVLKRLKNRSEPFDWSNKVNGRMLARFIEESGVQMEVKTYWYWRRRVLGKFVPSQPKVVWLNRKAFPRTEASVVATLYHELIHAVDHFNKEYYFHHGSNRYHISKESSAPYYVDAIAESVLGKDSDREKTTRIVTVRRVWWKPWTWF
jgi:predicted SprT family Zn-dependent metalloprotease